MFAPLTFLGSIYTSIVQGLIDVKHLLNLLTEPQDVVDVENAEDLPIMGSVSRNDNVKKNVPCPTCRRTMNADWLCCPFCKTDASWNTSNGSSVAMMNAKSSGVSVSFESKHIVMLYCIYTICPGRDLYIYFAGV